jgi:hypothetical protein
MKKENDEKKIVGYKIEVEKSEDTHHTVHNKKVVYKKLITSL